MMQSDLFAPALSGFLLGAGLIVAIGAQNAFVLRQGLLKSHVFVIVLICSFADAVLIVAGVGGFGTFVKSVPFVLNLITLAGAAFLLFYGVLAFKRALHPQSLSVMQNHGSSLNRAVATVLALTFLNPHVYLDTVVLLGGLSARYPNDGQIAYGAGAIVASFCWFFSLGYGARLLVPVFAKAGAWRVLDSIIGIVMWALAARLVYSHFQLSGFLSPAGS